MPLKPSFGDRLVGPIVRRYANAEQSLLKWLARILMPIPGAAWLIRMLARLLRLRRGVKRITDDLDRDARGLVEDAIKQAWQTGHSTALTDLDADGDIPDGDQDISDDVAARVTATHPRMRRWTEDVFRTAVDAARDPALTETERAEAIQRALDRAAAAGVTGYTTPNGRNYALPTYVETVVRAGVTYAEVEAYTRTLTAQGHDLVIVSDVPQACELCTPFEGKVLSITGSTRGTQTVTDRFGRPVSVTVHASLAESRRAGLWHHGCRHTLTVWTADSTQPPLDAKPDPTRNRARQRQRTLERKVQARRRVVAVAQTPAAQRKARKALHAAGLKVLVHAGDGSDLPEDVRNRLREDTTPIAGPPDTASSSPPPPPPPTPGPSGSAAADEPDPVPHLALPLIRELFEVDDPDDDDLRDALAGLEIRYGPFTVELTEVEYSFSAGEVVGFSFAADIVDPKKGGKVGQLGQYVQLSASGRLIVHNEEIQLYEVARGRGFGGQFFRATENWYKRSGVDRIDLMAGLDDGGYAWARAGFEFDPEMTTASIGMIREHADTVIGDFSPADQDLVRRTLARFDGPEWDYPTPMELASLAGDDPKLGKKLMTGAEWYGVKKLNPPAS